MRRAVVVYLGLLCALAARASEAPPVTVAGWLGNNWIGLLIAVIGFGSIREIRKVDAKLSLISKALWGDAEGTGLLGRMELIEHDHARNHAVTLGEHHRTGDTLGRIHRRVPEGGAK